MKKDFYKKKAQLVEELDALRAELAEARARQVESESAESARIYRALVEHAPDAILMLHWRGTILAANQGAGRLFRLGDARELVGTRIFDAMPEDLRRLYSNRLRLVAQSAGEDTVEHPLVRRDGTTTTVESRSYVIREDDGTPRAMVAVMRDVSERRRVEERFEFAQFAVDSVPDPIAVIGPDGRFVFVNDAACRSTGYTREEHVSLSIHDINPDLPPLPWERIAATMRAAPRKVRGRHRTKSGELFPVEVQMVFHELNGVEYSCAMARDLRRTEDD